MGIKAVLKDHGEMDHEMGELEEGDQQEEGVAEDTDMQEQAPKRVDEERQPSVSMVQKQLHEEQMEIPRV